MNSIMTNGYKTFPVVNFSKVNTSGKLMVPVSQRDAMYARFKHISGFPEPMKGTGYSLSRVKVLDVLIDRLNRLSQNKIQEKPETLSRERIDALIDEYSSKLQAELKKPLQSALIGPVETGAVVNMMVN